MDTKKNIKEVNTDNPPVRKKPGPPKGVSNNPAGRKKGSVNKINYDVKKAIAEKVCKPDYVKSIFDDIDQVSDADKRAKLKIELVKLFVPRPMNEDEQKDKDIKSAIWNKLSGKESLEVNGGDDDTVTP